MCKKHPSAGELSKVEGRLERLRGAPNGWPPFLPGRRTGVSNAEGRDAREGASVARSVSSSVPMSGG
jgi:hypothetical protein